MKKLTILLITFLIIYLIYSIYNVNKINYVSICDTAINKVNSLVYDYLDRNNKVSSFNNYFNNSSVVNTYFDIKNNRTIKVNDTYYYLKRVLRESDVLVISVGMEELASNFDKYNIGNNYDYFNNMILEINRLIKEIKRYTYGKIIFIGYYNPTNYYDANIDRFFYDINIKLERLMLDNDIIYIDLYEMIKQSNYKEKNNMILNIHDIKKIANIIEFYLA